jgi:DNA replication ATP-dependent helicase Dna2
MATFSRPDHIGFLDAELAAQIQQFQQKLETTATVLLEKGDLFIAQFLKLNEQGQMILKLNTEKRGVPRRGDYVRAMLVRDQFQSYKSWGNLTYGNLIQQGQINYSEVVTLWHHNADDPRYTLVAFNGLDAAFAEVLVEGCIVVLGPQEPPIEYLINLQNLIRNAPSNAPASQLLDMNIAGQSNDWRPAPISNEPLFLLNQLQVADTILVQGPPGTGKTTLLAKIITLLLGQGKRVLVTALTNRALIELASKPALSTSLAEGRIYKSGLKWDEKIEMPQLQGITEIFSAPCCLTLATFFVSSAWALNSIDSKAFDVVIVDEASQALLAMLAASHQLASKTIWVGDTAQLPPVVILSDDEITKRKAWFLIEGMSTVVDQLAYPSFQLTYTFRLPPRAAQFTGIFYRNALRAADGPRPNLDFPEIPAPHRDWLHRDGGPVLQLIPMTPGDPAPKEMLLAILNWVQALSAICEPDLKIVILAKLRKTVRDVQWALTQTFGPKNNIQVDTVERVQGLTCDICLFLLPDAHLSMALNQRLFNVATSRAQRHTILIASDQIHGITSISIPVKQFISRLPVLDSPQPELT